MAKYLHRKSNNWIGGLLRRVPVEDDGFARVRARQIYILPTGFGLMYAVVAGLMLIGSLNYQNSLGILFTFLMVSLGITAMHHCWLDLLGLAVRVRSGREVFAGSPARFEVTLVNERKRLRYDLGLSVGVERVAARCVGPRDHVILGVNVATHKRGELPLDELVVDTRHPMQLFRAWCLVTCNASILVYPKPLEWAPSATTRVGEDQSSGYRRGEGSEDFEGPRGYRPGDSPRRIDWKAAARERGLVIKQFSAEVGSEAWIDWDQTLVAGVEQRLSLMAKQIQDAVGAGLRFGLLLPGVEIAPGVGDVHAKRCLRELALFDGVDADQYPL